MELVFMLCLLAVIGFVMCEGTTSAVKEAPPKIVDLVIENSHRKEEMRSTRCYRGGEAWG